MTAGVGEPVTLIATVTLGVPGAATVSGAAASAGSAHATGTVTFYVDGVQVGAAALVDGVARLEYAFTTPGAHDVTASYGGDQNVDAVGAAASNVVDVTVTAPAPQPNTSPVTPGDSAGSAGMPSSYSAGAPTGALASTGADHSTLVLLALALVAGGVVLVRTRSRLT